MEKQEKIVSMFNNIAPTYDKANRVLSMGIDKSWRDKACNKTFELYGKKEIEKHLEKFGLIDNLLGYTIKKNKSSKAKKIKSWKDNLGSSYTYEVIK